MDNCIEDYFYRLNDWLDAKYATYGNLKNTFSGYLYDPIIYDYIFYKTNSLKVLIKISATAFLLMVYNLACRLNLIHQVPML